MFQALFYREHSCEQARYKAAFVILSRATVTYIFPNSIENFQALSYSTSQQFDQVDHSSSPDTLCSLGFQDIFYPGFPLTSQIASSRFLPLLSLQSWLSHGSVLGHFLQPHSLPGWSLSRMIPNTTSLPLSSTFLSLAPTSPQNSQFDILTGGLVGIPNVICSE